MVPYYS